MVDHEKNAEESLEIFVHGYPNPVLYPGRFRPQIKRRTKTNLASSQEIGLAFQTKQLRFVSCYKETPHWILKINELIFAFDTMKWLLIVLFLIVGAYILKSSPLAAHQRVQANLCNV